jgi:hypothetical protein
MKNTKNAIVILASIMVILGTTLTPVLLQQVNAALQLRSQHMNQENLCYRTNICRQSNTGQNTLGNDNQVTGFADQSDNIQQTATPTPTVTTPTVTPTPTPTPTTATLTVIKNVIARNFKASDFQISINGNNPNPASFPGSETGTNVTLGSGAYNVTETQLNPDPNHIFNTDLSRDCNGSIQPNQHKTCTITNIDTGPPEQ